MATFVDKVAQRGFTLKPKEGWLRGVDLNHRPLGYEPNELPDCSTPHFDHSQCHRHRQTEER
jgi:hypothetical protein